MSLLLFALSNSPYWTGQGRWSTLNRLSALESSKIIAPKKWNWREQFWARPRDGTFFGLNIGPSFLAIDAV